MGFWWGVGAGACGVYVLSLGVVLAAYRGSRKTGQGRDIRTLEDVVFENIELRRENEWLREMWDTEPAEDDGGAW